MTPAEIRRMTQAERLQAMEALWDALLHEGTPIEAPPWHAEVLAERKQKIEAGQGEFLNLDELKAARDR